MEEYDVELDYILENANLINLREILITPETFFDPFYVGKPWFVSIPD